MWEKISCPKQYYFTNLLSDQPDDTELIGKKSNEWREELYRQALVASLDSLRASDYDIELFNINYEQSDNLYFSTSNGGYVMIEEVG